MKHIKAIPFFLLFALVGCRNTSQNVQNDVQNEIVEESEPQEEVTTIEETIYAEDELVNQFIIDYQNVSGITITDIKKGNIRTKYFGYSGNVYIEMLNGGTGFKISYGFSTKNGALTEEEIYDILTDCLKVFGASDEEISQTIMDFTDNNEGDVIVTDYKTNDSITCTYVPNKDLSSGFSYGRIDIVCASYQ